MVNALFKNGRNNYLTGNLNWTSDTVGAALLNFGTASTAIKTISGATNATPIVVTATSHGFAVNDFVYINGIVGNEATNGYWQVSAITSNTFTIVLPPDANNPGNNTSGSGSYSSGGYAVNLGASLAANFNDFSAAQISSTVNLTGESASNGTANATSPVTFSGVPGSSTIHAVVLFKNTGTGSTSKMIMLNTGYFVVQVAATASSSATSITVDPLKYPIPSGSVIYFSNGKSATLSALASAGDRTLSVSALANSITVNSVGLAPVTNAGLPVTTASSASTINYNFDTGTNKVFTL